MNNKKPEKPKVLVVLGPTATGKSALAVSLAKKLGGEVISADSRQVYKGMDLGTGKITKKEMSGVKHYLLDITDPNKYFSVVRYKQLAEKAIQEIINKHKLPIICGGTGFYIDSVIKNIEFPDVEPNQKLRKSLHKKSTDELFSMLKRLSPSRAKSIDKNNKVRIIRAIEIAKKLGEVPKMIQSQTPYNPIFIGLDLPDAELKKKIHIRLFARVKAAMINEVKKLHKDGVNWKRLESFGLEYGYIALYLQNKMSKEEMLKKLETEIWHFAKRQRTWFRRNEEIRWFKPIEKNKILNFVK
jgi:tRNA dimethylallyltransferase